MVYVHCTRVRQLVLCDVEFAKADLVSGHSFIQAAGALVLVAQAAAHRRFYSPATSAGVGATNAHGLVAHALSDLTLCQTEPFLVLGGGVVCFHAYYRNQSGEVALLDNLTNAGSERDDLF